MSIKNNSDFYKTELGRKVVATIQKTSMLLLDKCYEQIPADNIKFDLSDGWISSMNEMLDHYSAKLIPWQPNKDKEPSVIVETNESFIIDVPLLHEESGKIVDADIHMIFEFRYDGSCDFNGIHY